MKTFHDSCLLFKKGFSIIINDFHESLEESTCYYFDYDQRYSSINMDFPHFHSFFEIMILLSPKARHSIAGTNYELKNNDIILLQPAVLHQSEYLPGAPSSRIIIDFMLPKSLIDNSPAHQQLLSIFNDPSTPILRFNSSMQKTIFTPLNEIAQISLQEHDRHIKNLMINTKFTEFLFGLWQFQSHNIYEQEKQEGIKSRIHEVTAYIHNHYHETLSLELLADTFFLNKYYLSHQFKLHTGYTLVHYIQLARISNAQYLLKNTECKITDIAERTGFCSFSQFNRVFKKICGVAPTEYRRQKENIFIF